VLVFPLVPVTETIGTRDSGHVARAALARVQVHAQAGRGVDLDDVAGGDAGAGRLADVGQPQVDAADVQSYDRRGADAHPGDRRVHRVGHVLAGAAGGEVGVVAQLDHLAAGGHGRGRQALAV